MKVNAKRYIICFFAILLFIVYPLYNEGSYIGMAEAKYDCLKVIMWLGFVSVLAGVCYQMCAKSTSMRNLIKLSFADDFVLIYACMVIASMIFTCDPYTSRHGLNGWYVGGFFILTLCLAYFLISRFVGWNVLCAYALLIGSFLVFLLGLLNRFDIWPVPMEGSENNGYISTIGNIGWFCGFYAVTATVGATVYFFYDHLGKVWRTLLSLYLLVAFAVGFAQGADSMILYFVTLFVALIYFAYVRKNSIYRWLEIVIMWCLSSQIIHLLRTIWPRRFRYDSANFCNFLDNRMLTFWVMVFLALVYIVLKHYGFEPGKRFTAVCRIIPVLVILAIGLYVIAAVVYTGRISGGVESDIYQYDEFLLQKLLKRLFYIDGGWGSGRGAAINAGIMIFRDMPFVNKLFGAGPDCFASYAYMNNSIASYLDVYFSGAMLTNAHCELITSLVNQGILGTIAYYGIFVSYIVQSITSKEVNEYKMCVSVVSICYLCSNMLNYAHILSMPFMFVLLGGDAVGEQESVGR